MYPECCLHIPDRGGSSLSLLPLSSSRPDYGHTILDFPSDCMATLNGTCVCLAMNLHSARGSLGHEPFSSFYSDGNEAEQVVVLTAVLLNTGSLNISVQLEWSSGSGFTAILPSRQQKLLSLVCLRSYYKYRWIALTESSNLHNDCTGFRLLLSLATVYSDSGRFLKVIQIFLIKVSNESAILEHSKNMYIDGV